ncbi:MAG: sigma-70 family RNA polymerase sigma factor [Candidatus Levyibacteriota bacterium]
MERESRLVGEAEKTRGLLKACFKQGSIKDMAISLDRFTANVLEAYPGIGTYDFLQKLSFQLPQKISNEVQKSVVLELASIDNNTKGLSEKVFMLFSSRTILTVVDSFFIEGIDSLQDREEMIHEVFAHLGDKMSEIKPEQHVTTQVHRIARKAISKYLADKENMSVHFTKNPANRRIISIVVNEELSGKTRFKRDEIASLAEELSKQTGLDEFELSAYLRYRNSFINVDDGCADSALEVEDGILKQNMRKTLQDVLQELNTQERRVLEERFGLIDGEERTLKQVGLKIGVSTTRVKQVEIKALKKLRHPYRSRKLNNLFL